MKRPLFPTQYESEEQVPQNYTELGDAKGALLNVRSIKYPDAKRFVFSTRDMSLRQMLTWLELHKSEMLPTTHIVGSTVSDDSQLEVNLRGHHNSEMLMIERSLQTIYRLDRYLSLSNEALIQGGYFFCHARTGVLKKQLIMSRYPWGISHIIYLFYYFWHRVCPKLKLTNPLYYNITGGSHRNFNRVELLGRLYHAGFEVIHESFRYGEYFIVAQKAKSPIYGDTPSISPIIKLRRVGKDGKLINVYRFRTMYSYSEYIQPYVFRYQHLASGGKFANDYRVNSWGRFLRRCWLDELPMVVNMMKGQMKLVGVRPLSRHYFSLYSPEVQELRIQTKPGLLPPFYYERKKPETLEEIQDSERRYCEAYLKHPFLTDWRYFWGIVFNILFRRVRSA